MKTIGEYRFGVGSIQTFQFGVLKIYHDTACRTYKIEIGMGRLNLKVPQQGGLSKEQLHIGLDFLTAVLESLGYTDEAMEVFRGHSRFNIEHPRPRPNAILRRLG